MLRTYADSDGLGLAALVRKGELTPIELVETAVATIEKLNPQLNAIIHKLYEMGRSVANEVDPSAPFAGVPLLAEGAANEVEGRSGYGLVLLSQKCSGGLRYGG